MTGEITRKSFILAEGYIPCDNFFILNIYIIACFTVKLLSSCASSCSFSNWSPQCPATQLPAGGLDDAKLKLYHNPSDKCPHEWITPISLHQQASVVGFFSLFCWWRFLRRQLDYCTFFFFFKFLDICCCALGQLEMFVISAAKIHTVS